VGRGNGGVKFASLNPRSSPLLSELRIAVEVRRRDRDRHCDWNRKRHNNLCSRGVMMHVADANNMASGHERRTRSEHASYTQQNKQSAFHLKNSCEKGKNCESA
jgi:hypothetical protein